MRFPPTSTTLDLHALEEICDMRLVQWCTSRLKSYRVLPADGGRLSWRLQLPGKGQVTIPAELRKKYVIREGMKMEGTDEQRGLLFRPIPRLKDLAGVDAGKYTYKAMVEKLDRFRSRSR